MLDEGLRVPAGAEWRGALAAPRDSSAFRCATEIVQRARMMTHSIQVGDTLQASEDESDFDWQRGGEALWNLCGAHDEAVASATLTLLASEVCACVRACVSACAGQL